MANINKKAALIGVGVVAAAGVAGSAFAASITTSAGNAGQGSTVTSGYTMGAVSYGGDWTNTAASASSGAVTSFTFNLKKAADGTGTSTVTSANTTVFAQLVATANGNWVSCTVGTSPAAGTVTCSPTGGQQKNLSEVTGVNVVAYDK